MLTTTTPSAAEEAGTGESGMYETETRRQADAHWAEQQARVGPDLGPGNLAVHQATANLQRALEVVGNRVDDMEQRLQPVLGPDYSTTEASPGEPRRETSPVAETVGLAADQAERLAVRLQTLLDRLEV
jgi:hypothetical protein